MLSRGPGRGFSPVHAQLSSSSARRRHSGLGTAPRGHGAGNATADTQVSNTHYIIISFLVDNQDMQKSLVVWCTF